MNDVGRLRVEYRRRCIVDMLAKSPDDTLNAYILRSGMAELGEDVRADEMAALAEWLAGAGLVKFVHQGPPLVLRLTDRGRGLAAKRFHVDGVLEMD